MNPLPMTPDPHSRSIWCTHCKRLRDEHDGNIWEGTCTWCLSCCAALGYDDDPVSPVPSMFLDEQRQAWAAWIANAIDGKTPRQISGTCFEVASDLRDAFPELVLVYGHVTGGPLKDHGHWWCQTPVGAIIDPTRIQFGFSVTYVDRYQFRPGGTTWNAWCNADVRDLGPKEPGLHTLETVRAGRLETLREEQEEASNA